MKSLNILFPVMGGAGDIYPNIGIARRLLDRGHEVAFITSSYYEPVLRRQNLQLASAGTTAEYLAQASHPDLYHPLKGGALAAQHIVVNPMRPTYQHIAERHIPGQTVLVAPSTSFGARIAHEKLGIPLVVTHVAPAFLHNVYDAIWLPGRECRGWLCRSARRALSEALDRWSTDPLLAPSTTAFRGELGLTPVRRLFLDWVRPATRVIGLFPKWFVPQPERAPDTHLTGFPEFDDNASQTMPQELGEFLDAGDPPIVVAASSGMRHTGKYFAVAVEAIRKLGKRGLLLTWYPEQLPQLPATIRQCGFVPFSMLLPRAAALVHHGGIGTIARAISAGIPQLIVPQSFDQPYNAARLCSLGAGAQIPFYRFKTSLLAKKLGMLLNSETVARRCRELATRLRGVDAEGEACRLIEGIFEDRSAVRR